MSDMNNNNRNKDHEVNSVREPSVPEENNHHEVKSAQVIQSRQQVCSNCGFEIHSEKFCPNCGKEVNRQPYIEKSSGNSKKNLKIGFIVGGIFVVAVVVILLVYFVLIPSIKYNEAMDAMKRGGYDEAIQLLTELGDYKDAPEKKQEAETMRQFLNLKASMQYAYNLCTADGTSLAADGLSITVDARNQYDQKALSDVVTITSYLNLPDSLLNEFENTNALMGRQTETYGNIQVSWSYHPDYGLDVIYKIVY